MASSRNRQPSPVATSTAALAVALLLGLSSIASATEPVAVKNATMSAGGGMGAPGMPEVRDVICVSGCVGLRKATIGGLVQVTGRNLAEVSKMTFSGSGGRVTAPVSKAGDTTAAARVPVGAITGKVRVKDDFGNASGLSPVALEIRPRSELGTAGALALTEAVVVPHKAYFFGVRAPRLTYIVASDQPLNDLRIDIVNGNGAVIKSFFRDDIEANSTQTVRWNGKSSSGDAAPNGRYAFRISSQSGERAVRARETGSLGFRLFGYVFPIRGPHSYGDGIGAPRAGHTHQGQDVFADCGTKLVAARGGRVQYAGYHSAAGNYVVIDGKATGVDFVYMHMLAPSLFREGQIVHSGEKIGQVGESGNASGCHLHYEMWSPPGWYEGGHFLDPAPYLKRWDRYS